MTVPALKPMKVSHAADEVVSVLLEDPRWVLEQKMDGARALAVVTFPADGPAQVEWLSSSGGPLKFAAAVQHLANIENDLIMPLQVGAVDEVILDGEIIVSTGEFHLFDMPHLVADSHTRVTPEHTYGWRRQMLAELFDGWDHSGAIRQVASAGTSHDKQALWAAIQAQGAEGAILKHVDGTYRSGIRTKEQVKAKLVKTADLVVLSANRTFKDNGVVHTGSAGLGVYVTPEYVQDNPGKYTIPAGGDLHEGPFILPIVSASLIGKDLTIAQGDVVEVAYLYRDAKGGLIQPRILRKRLAEEKRPEDCTLEQFPTYSRATV